MQLFDRGKTTGTVNVAGWEARAEDEREVQVFQVGPTYFGTTGMHLMRGRDFTEEDVAGAGRVAAINDVMARRFFGSADPIGQTISSGGTYQIVGIVRTAKYNSIRDQDPPALFVPYTTVRSRPRITYILRTSGADENIARLAASAAQAGDEHIPVDIAPVTSLVGRSMGQERLLAALSIGVRHVGVAPALDRPLRHHDVLGDRAHRGNRHSSRARRGTLAREVGRDPATVVAGAAWPWHRPAGERWPVRARWTACCSASTASIRPRSRRRCC